MLIDSSLNYNPEFENLKREINLNFEREADKLNLYQKQKMITVMRNFEDFEGMLNVMKLYKS